MLIISSTALYCICGNCALTGQSPHEFFFIAVLFWLLLIPGAVVSMHFRGTTPFSPISTKRFLHGTWVYLHNLTARIDERTGSSSL